MSNSIGPQVCGGVAWNIRFCKLAALGLKMRLGWQFAARSAHRAVYVRAHMSFSISWFLLEVQCGC